MNSSLISELQSIGAFRVAEPGQYFELKSGEKSKFYADFRRVISYPKLFAQLCYELSKLVERKETTDGVAICGVPLGSIAYAQMVAHNLQTPALFVRPSAKEHGLKNAIEGDNFAKPIVVVEDVLTSGQSVSLTIDLLVKAGKRVKQIIALLDRRPPLDLNQPISGVPVRSLFSLSQLAKAPPFHRQIKAEPNSCTDRLLQIRRKKHTNLVVAVDLVDPVHVLEACREIGPYVCAIKLHLDLMDFSKMTRAEFTRQLGLLKCRYEFLVIEDRKFADIGQIAGMQLDSLLLQFPLVIDMVTVHAICGKPSLTELDKRGTGLIVVQQLSCEQNLIDPLYTAKADDMMNGLKNVVGVVSQTLNPRWLTFGPGISLEQKSDHAGQQYKSPSAANADLFIVGRAVTQPSHEKTRADAAKAYQQYCQSPSFAVSKL